MRKTYAKKQIAFLTFFLVNVFTLHSQNNNFLNVNVIISDSTEKALKDVAIYNSQQKIIGLTDNSGTTTISVRYGDIIVLSHISYEQKRLKISKESVVKDEDGKNYMFVILREKATLLPEAQVIENAPHLAYKNKEVWIVDYVVGDEGITAITTTGRKSFLLHLGFEQDTLSIKQIDKKFESLFRDVFGNIHLLGPDSTYQVYSDKGKMQLLYGVTLEKHNNTFKPIAAMTDSILVTKQSYYYGQEFAFFSVNRNNQKSNRIDESCLSRKHPDSLRLCLLQIH